MRTLLLPLLLLLIISSCTDPEKIDNGIRIIHYPGSDLIHQEVEMKDGKKNGIAKEYFRNGKLKRKQYYSNDSLNDSSMYFHNNGQLAKLQFFKNGLPHGSWKDYNKEGKLVAELYFKDGMFDSVSTKYTYRTGRVLDRVSYKMGVKNGIEEHYYPNGKLKSKQFFKKGFECTGLKEYSENGNEIKNSFSIRVNEKDEILLNNTLRYYITLSNPNNDDEVYHLYKYTGDSCVCSGNLLKKEGGAHVLEFHISKGGFVMEKVWLAAIRRSAKGNKHVKIHSFNAAGEHH